MNSMSPDLARLLVTERLDDAARRRQRLAARRSASAAKVPQQRRWSGLLARMIPRTGVHVPTA
jgi:hypothetical protein